eukprot:NODE_293_length_11597_cov_0.181771.p1 type:complete len:465 gc:universal NODE_293_length_11597_cov_0.181771:3691-2297(-)
MKLIPILACLLYTFPLNLVSYITLLYSGNNFQIQFTNIFKVSAMLMCSLSSPFHFISLYYLKTTDCSTALYYILAALLYIVMFFESQFLIILTLPFLLLKLKKQEYLPITPTHHDVNRMTFFYISCAIESIIRFNYGGLDDWIVLVLVGILLFYIDVDLNSGVDYSDMFVVLLCLLFLKHSLVGIISTLLAISINIVNRIQFNQFDYSSKKLLLFLVINFAYMFIQLIYGYLTNSLGLISDAIHMFFDCLALGIGLYYQQSKNQELGAFINAILLILISFMISAEGIERMLYPKHMQLDGLLGVSVGGLLVNLVGVVFFHDAHSHGHSHGKVSNTEKTSIQEDHHHDHHSINYPNHDHDHHQHDHHQHDHHQHDHNQHDHHQHDHEHDHSDDNMHAVFLHILADTLGSIGVIVSTLLIDHTGYFIFDPLASLLIAVLIFASIYPMYKQLYRKFDKVITELHGYK